MDADAQAILDLLAPVPRPVDESAPPRPSTSARLRRMPAQGKHLTPVTAKEPRAAPLPGPKDFSNLARGIPTNHELLAATAELLRKFHGRAFRDGGNPGKQAAVAFGVLVDKLTLLRSQAAAPVAAEDAEIHREAVARLVQRLAALIG